MASRPWDVKLGSKIIDTVWFDDTYRDPQEVLQSLIGHDGYDVNIKVKSPVMPRWVGHNDSKR